MEKIILTDCDGCLCNWNKSFNRFMAEKGYQPDPDEMDNYQVHIKYNITHEEQRKLTREFNEGPWIEHLEPYADAVEYVKKLASEGFKFIVVTSVSDSPISFYHRTRNLSDLFGYDVFEEIHCLSMGKYKYTDLLQWKDSGLFWIEDHFDQAVAGLKAGLRPILIDHPYNVERQTTRFIRVDHDHPWEEIYHIVHKAYDQDK